MNHHRRALRGVFVVAAGWGILTAATAEASRMGRGQAPTTRLSFSAFLRAGQGLWDGATPRLPRGLALARTPDGAAMPSLFLDYLIYRRGLDPARFDAHHPNIAGLVASAMTPAVTPSFVLSPPVLTPSPQVVQPTAAPLHPALTQTIPEPSSILVAGLILGAAAVARSRRRSPFSAGGASA